MDDDNDGVLDNLDNCPKTYNPEQENFDGDSMGDLCDPDDDNDNLSDTLEQTLGLDPLDDDTDDDSYADGIDVFPSDPTRKKTTHFAISPLDVDMGSDPCPCFIWSHLLMEGE